MHDFEKLGAFYLGRTWDPDQKELRDDLVLYESRDLTTHAVCVGMTGSGKTGLGIALLEEAAIDGIPALVLDPKGDLGNLMLTFPDLAAGDFQPWVDPEVARREGIGLEEYAKKQAERWRTGLEQWGQDGERIRRMREATEFAIYTPGSLAGRPLSILDSFAAPPAAVRDDAELLGDRAASTVTSLLGLCGIDTDPLRSREHVLLSTILLGAWQKGEDVDLGRLLQWIQTPPFDRVGVLELDAYYPAKERFELAMALNNLIAAPGFQPWMRGEPLDVGRLLYGPGGKPRLAILSIAHLGDAERMFFVSLLLGQIVTWMRGQPGTDSLRAILYIDEIFGFFPPVANPPSKAPLLRLVKQARAFGLGVVLASQNPVDLDYKALANCGTWFVGKLQTERDRARLLDGLQGAGSGLDRQQIEPILDQLGSRVFLLHDVHAKGPRVFQTRWAMSYLRGPMTREEIKRLGGAPTAPVEAPAPTPAAVPPAGPANAPAPGTAPTAPAHPSVARSQASATAPALPPDVPRTFLAPRATAPAAATLVYAPLLYGTAVVRFTDAKLGIDDERAYWVLAPPPAAPGSAAWLDAQILSAELTTAESPVAGAASWDALPADASQPRSYGRWQRELADWLYRSQTLDIFHCAELGVSSIPGESARDFRIRLRDLWHEERDRRTDALRAKYAPRLTRLEEQIRRAEQTHARESEQLQQQKMQSAISMGATLLGAFLGGRRSAVGRATTAARGLGRSRKEARDVERAGDNIETAKQRLQELESEFQQELAGLESAFDASTIALATRAIRPKKAAVAVRSVQLAWAPHWQAEDGSRTPGWA